MSSELLGKIPEDSFKIMFAGNIGEAQDFYSIIEVAKLLKNEKNIQWIILGGGRREEWVRTKIKEYKLEECFHLLGSHPLERMPAYYANASAIPLLINTDEWRKAYYNPYETDTFIDYADRIPLHSADAVRLTMAPGRPSIMYANQELK